MHKMDLSSVIVQEMYFSRHARRKYRLAPQRRGLGTIDLRYVRTQRELYKHWMYCVGKKGKFSLLARDSKGRLRKCVAVITVGDSGVRFRDNRCALCVILRNRSKKRPVDMRI